MWTVSNKKKSKPDYTGSGFFGKALWPSGKASVSEYGQAGDRGFEPVDKGIKRANNGQAGGKLQHNTTESPLLLNSKLHGDL
jgi:hypothetical protein